MPDRYELRFMLTREDILAGAEAVMRGPEWQEAERHGRRKTLKQVLLASPLIVGGAAWLIGRGSATSGMYVEGGVLGLAFAGFLALLLPRVDVWSKIKHSKLNQLRGSDLSGITGEYTVVVEERFVQLTSPGFAITAAWPLVTVKNLDGFFLFTHASGSTYLPKRVFETPAVAAEFYERAMAWRKEGQKPQVERLANFVASRDAWCPECRYNLRGTRSQTCPECGEALWIEKLVVA